MKKLGNFKLQTCLDVYHYRVSDVWLTFTNLFENEKTLFRRTNEKPEKKVRKSHPSQKKSYTYVRTSISTAHKSFGVEKEKIAGLQILAS